MNINPKYGFRIYKSKIGKVRKDGSTLVSNYGCNEEDHYITYDQIWFNPDGKAFDGISDVKKPKFIGKCEHNQTCKDLGFFTLFPEKWGIKI